MPTAPEKSKKDTCDDHKSKDFLDRITKLKFHLDPLAESVVVCWAGFSKADIQKAACLRTSGGEGKADEDDSDDEDEDEDDLVKWYQFTAFFVTPYVLCSTGHVAFHRDFPELDPVAYTYIIGNSKVRCMCSLPHCIPTPICSFVLSCFPV